MRISGQGFILRPFEKKDSAALARYCNNIMIAKQMRDTFPFPYTENDAVRYIENVLFVKPPLTHFVIEINNEAAGSFTILPKSDVYRRNAEIGYSLAEPHWGNGIMSRVIQLMTDYVFSNFDVIRIYAEVFSPNLASMRTLEKAGFRKEAVMEKNVFKNGQLLDTHVFSLLKTSY